MKKIAYFLALNFLVGYCLPIEPLKDIQTIEVPTEWFYKESQLKDAYEKIYASSWKDFKNQYFTLSNPKQAFSSYPGWWAIHLKRSAKKINLNTKESSFKKRDLMDIASSLDVIDHHERWMYLCAAFADPAHDFYPTIVTKSRTKYKIIQNSLIKEITLISNEQINKKIAQALKNEVLDPKI